MKEKGFFVAATGQNVGKTTVCLGLVSGLKKRLASVGYMKPIGQEHIETESGRPPDHQFHGPRTLDLDLLYCGDIQLSHSSLTLPHPRMLERLFVLKPLADICPDQILSSDKRTIRELRDAIELQFRFSQSSKFISFF